MIQDPVLEVLRLGFPWQTFDPFLFCAHHDDAYPSGNDQLGPAASLEGRVIGQDFAGMDGWRMYHGDVVPGFPQHPHRGFETVTLVRSGLVDHSDSLGATARFGPGDVQWVTAGRGIVHSEMFPLVHANQRNPLELFQIWLNLPRSAKMAAPYFTMFWRGMIRMEPQAEWILPNADPGLKRTVYFFGGEGLRVAGAEIPPYSGLRLRPEVPAPLRAGPEPCQLLLLQGRPIGDPVARYGPFVMTSPGEIHQAFEDYRATGFGGWPWPQDGPVHARDAGRFARHPDGRIDAPASERDREFDQGRP